MSFKNILLILTICSVTGCSEFINGKKKEEEVLRFNSDRFACLSKVPETLRSLNSEESSPENLEESLVCLETSLTYFKKRTKGTVPDGYSVQDIRSFFGNYLGDKDRVSDQMAAQMMKVKKALFGGTELIIAKSELQGLIDLVANIRQEIPNLKPVWSIMLINNFIKPDKSQILHSHKLLQESLTKLVLSTNLVRSEYSFADFKSLMTEAEKFVKAAPGQSSVDIMRWLPLAESVKVHLFSDRADMSSTIKWKEAVNMVMELHLIFSLYQYHYKGLEFYSPAAFQTGDEILVAAISLLDRSWWMNKDGIPFKETEKLLQAFETLKIIPEGTTAKTMNESYQVIVRKFLDRDKANKAVGLKTLAKKHLATLKSEYRGFKAVQDFNNSLPGSFTYDQLIEILNNKQTVQVQTFSEISDELLQLSWKDWHFHLKQPLPLLYLKTGELVLDRNVKASSEWSWDALTRLNLMKFLNRLLMMSFGTTRTMDLSKEVLDEDSMRQFYADFWNLGVQIKAFDERSGNSGKRTFFEADHFVYAGNGDKEVRLDESYELVNIIFSAGLNGLKKIQNDLLKSSCALAENDDFGNPWLDEACFKKLLRQNFSRYFKNLTALDKWVSGLNDEEWDYYYSQLINFARSKPDTVGRIETGDLRTLVVINHYIESMYLKIDLDEDDKLSVPELIDGSARFVPFFKNHFKLEPRGPFLRETQEYLIDYALSRVFACMVITGEMPKIKSCTPAFFKDAFLTKPYSNRSLILRTLNSLKSSIK